MESSEDSNWNMEVEIVRCQLIRGGIPPLVAVEKAVEIVSKRRKKNIEDDLPSDVKDAIEKY